METADRNKRLWSFIAWLCSTEWYLPITHKYVMSGETSESFVNPHMYANRGEREYNADNVKHIKNRMVTNRSQTQKSHANSLNIQ